MREEQDKQLTDWRQRFQFLGVLSEAGGDVVVYRVCFKSDPDRSLALRESRQPNTDYLFQEADCFEKLRPADRPSDGAFPSVYARGTNADGKQWAAVTLLAGENVRDPLSLPIGERLEFLRQHAERMIELWQHNIALRDYGPEKFLWDRANRHLGIQDLTTARRFTRDAPPAPVHEIIKNVIEQISSPQGYELTEEQFTLLKRAIDALAVYGTKWGEKHLSVFTRSEYQGERHRRILNREKSHDDYLKIAKKTLLGVLGIDEGGLVDLQKQADKQPGYKKEIIQVLARIVGGSLGSKEQASALTSDIRSLRRIIHLSEDYLPLAEHHYSNYLSGKINSIEESIRQMLKAVELTKNQFGLRNVVEPAMYKDVSFNVNRWLERMDQEIKANELPGLILKLASWQAQLVREEETALAQYRTNTERLQWEDLAFFVKETLAPTLGFKGDVKSLDLPTDFDWDGFARYLQSEMQSLEGTTLRLLPAWINTVKRFKKEHQVSLDDLLIQLQEFLRLEKERLI